MNNIHVIMPGGGPFSRFLQCGVIPLADVEFDNVFWNSARLWKTMLQMNTAKLR